MKDEKRELYTVVWKQTYPMKPLQDAMDELVERMLEYSDYTEAKQVIAQIKSGI
jgi:predicted RNA-binding protein with PIN domain